MIEVGSSVRTTMAGGGVVTTATRRKQLSGPSGWVGFSGSSLSASMFTLPTLSGGSGS